MREDDENSNSGSSRCKLFLIVLFVALILYQQIPSASQLKLVLSHDKDKSKLIDLPEVTKTSNHANQQQQKQKQQENQEENAEYEVNLEKDDDEEKMNSSQVPISDKQEPEIISPEEQDALEYFRERYKNETGMEVNFFNNIKEDSSRLISPFVGNSSCQKRKHSRRVHGFRRPDFIIVGAMKSGTTTLKDNLNKHQNVYIPQHETHFFDQYYSKGPSYYDSVLHGPFFVGQHLVGDKTPHYMMSPSAPERIARYSPGAKLIFLLRNPIDRAFSHWKLSVLFKKETRSFEDAIYEEIQVLSKALQLEEEKWFLQNATFPYKIGTNFSVDWELNPARKTYSEKSKLDIGKYINHAYDRDAVIWESLVNYTISHSKFAYLLRGFYSYQIRNYLRWFPPCQMFIEISERFRTAPKFVLNRSLKFLGLGSSASIRFENENESTIHLKNKVPKLLNWTTRKFLHGLFKPLNEDLERLIGKEIKFWKYKRIKVENSKPDMNKYAFDNESKIKPSGHDNDRQNSKYIKGNDNENDDESYDST